MGLGLQECRLRQNHAENPGGFSPGVGWGVLADLQSVPRPRTAKVYSVGDRALTQLGVGGVPGSRPCWCPTVLVPSAPLNLPACELPTSEPRARLRRTPSTCRAELAHMIAAESEGSPAESGPGAPCTRTWKRGPPEPPRAGGGGGGCGPRRVPESWAGWQGRGVRLGGRGGRLGSRLSHSRAPSGRAPRGASRPAAPRSR